MKKKRSRIKINKFFIVLFFFAFFCAIVKLSYVALSSTVDGMDLTEFAESRNTTTETLYASRGTIYDVYGEVLAKNVNSYTLVAYLSESRTTDPDNPQHVVDKEATAQALSEVLDMTYEYALARLSVEGAYQVEFGTAGKDLTENQKAMIEALDLDGIGFISGTKRYYKQGSAASYIIGYARSNDDGEIVGEMGIEYYFNEELKGTDGETMYQKDAYGYQMGDAYYTIEPVSGSDIYLTIDSQIQLILEDTLNTLEENYTFSWATITVMDANSGAIVGSASSPDFNLNTLDGLTSYINPLVGYTYEPGSTMKIFSWLAAMENGVYDGEEEFTSGSIEVAGATINDFNNDGWGVINYDTAFAYSSNVGATNLALKLGTEKLRSFYELLGFGSKTGIELPGEESGVLKITYESELATASFGQGITTTPIQTLQALTILTNDGVELKPYIVDKIVDENGEVTYEGGRTELGQKVSSESVEKVYELMYDVVYNGLSTMWQPSNVTLAGKTGTAQIADPNGGYLTGSTDYIRSFAGIFPYEDPEYIIYISVKQIDGGASAVAKAVTSAVESIANYANITNTTSDLDLSKIIELSNYMSSSVETTVEELEKVGLKVIKIGNGDVVINQYPLKGTKVLEGSKVFLLTNTEEYEMPDITGWSTSEVMSFCNLIGLDFSFTGYGVVSEFNFEVGEVIDLSKTLEVTLKTT